MDDMAQRLRQARIRAGFTHASDAAAAFGWSAPTYSSHENGHRGIKRDVAQKYARAFHVPLQWLLMAEGDGRGFAEQQAPALADATALTEPQVAPDNLMLEVKQGKLHIRAIVDRPGLQALMTILPTYMKLLTG